MSDRHQPVCAVFGGTGWVGSAIAREFLRSGWAVALLSRGVSESRFGHPPLDTNITVHRVDVTSEDSVHDVLGEVLRNYERLSAVVYTAGLTPDPDTPLSEYNVADWRTTLDVYLTGFFIVFQQVLPLLPRSGHLVAISSAVTRFASDALPTGIWAGHYACAKAGLDETCKWARREAHARGILLSRIAPAAIDTPFHRDAPLHRRPPAMIPVEQVASIVVQAVTMRQEVDAVLVPEPS